MTVVVDSSVLIDHLRGEPAAKAALTAARAAGERAVASSLTKVELIAGMRSGERRRTRELFSILRWIPVTDEIAERAGELARRFRASHQGVDVVDYVIAATAEELEAALWTTNVRHFPMFPRLAPPY